MISMKLHRRLLGLQGSYGSVAVDALVVPLVPHAGLAQVEHMHCSVETLTCTHTQAVTSTFTSAGQDGSSSGMGTVTDPVAPQHPVLACAKPSRDDGHAVGRLATMVAHMLVAVRLFAL